jgi:hypothetical protein
MNEELKNKVEELKKNSIICLSTFNGLHFPNSSGMLVTIDKELYSFNYFLDRTPTDYKEEANFVKLIKKLNDEEYVKLTDLLNSLTIDREIEDSLTMDLSVILNINYNGNHIERKLDPIGEIKTLVEKFLKNL